MRNIFNLLKNKKINKWDTFTLQVYEILPEAEIIEDLPSHPIINFKISNKTFKIYSVENILKRTKLCNEFNTFLQISGIDESEMNSLRKDVDEIVHSNLITKKNSIIINVSNPNNLDRVIVFIEEQKKSV
jgi:hypothetical protein